MINEKCVLTDLVEKRQCIYYKTIRAILEKLYSIKIITNLVNCISPIPATVYETYFSPLLSLSSHILRLNSSF